MELKKEHFRAYIFIEMQRGRKPSEIHEQLQQTDLDVPSRRTIFEWFRRFKDGRSSLEDDARCGRPLTATTTENVQRLQELIKEQPRISLRALSDVTGLCKDAVREILTSHLGLRKVCSTWVPHHLSESNKRDRVTCAESIIALFDENSFDYLLQHWATEDESWFLYETAATKEENKAWCHPSDAKPVVVRPKLTNKKTLLLLAFTGDGRVSAAVRAPGETLTSSGYIDFVRSTGEKWRHSRVRPVKLRDLLWQHDNARPHVSQETSAFFENRGVKLLKQSPYSPDLNQCDRWVFKHLKNLFRGKTFSDGDEILSAAVKELRSLPKSKFIRELTHLHEHCKLVLNNHGDYVVY